MRFAVIPAVVAAGIALGACGESQPPTAERACAEYGGVRANSFEPEGIDSNLDGKIDEKIGAEARCRNNVEIESDNASSIRNGDWIAEPINDAEAE